MRCVWSTVTQTTPQMASPEAWPPRGPSAAVAPCSRTTRVPPREDARSSRGGTASGSVINRALRRRQSVSEHDPVVASLDNLVTAVQEIDALAREAAERAEQLRSQREQGQPYREILSDDARPFPVELVARMTDALTDAGGKFTRA